MKKEKKNTALKFNSFNFLVANNAFLTNLNKFSIYTSYLPENIYMTLVEMMWHV